jgi:TPR repeat protein
MSPLIYFGGPTAAGATRATRAADAHGSRYARLDPLFPAPGPVDLDSLSAEEFESDMRQWLATVWVPRNRVPHDEELADFDLRQLEPEFRRDYAAGAWREMLRGATAEEIWISRQLGERQPFIWLVSRQQPQQPLDRVSRKRFFDAVDLVWLLGVACAQFRVVEPVLWVFTFDGETGHAIGIAGLNPFDYPHPSGVVARRGWFSFHDPWPARSLLAAGRNRAGVTAVEDYPRSPFWLIAPEDLARVLYGVLFPVHQWEHSIEQVATFAQSNEQIRRSGLSSSMPWGTETKPFDTEIHLAGGVTGCERVCSFGRGRLALDDGDLERADKWFEVAFQLDPATGTQAASVYEDREDRAAAQRWLARAAAAGDVPAMKWLGALLLEEDSAEATSDALMWFLAAAERGDADAARDAGVLLLRDDRFDEALKWLLVAAQHGDAVAAHEAGRLLIRTGRPGKAKEWLRRAAEGGDMEAAALLGMLLAQESPSEEARAWLERSVAAGVVAGAVMLAGIYDEAGDLGRARAVLERASSSSDPNLAPGAAAALGELLEAHDDLAGARAAYEQAVASNHPDAAPAAAARLGNLLAKQGDVEGARVAYQLAIDAHHPDDAPTAAINLGNLLREHDDPAGARAAYQQAIASDDPDVAPWGAILLGELLEEQGDLVSARAAYQQAVASNHPEVSVDAQQALRELDEQ